MDSFINVLDMSLCLVLALSLEVMSIILDGVTGSKWSCDPGK